MRRQPDRDPSQRAKLNSPEAIGTSIVSRLETEQAKVNRSRRRRWGTHLLHGTIGRLPIIRNHLDKHLQSAQAYVRRRKGAAVFFGRFTEALRVLVPGLAGMSDVHYPSFLACNVVRGALWGTAFAVLGYLAGASYQRVEKIASRVGLGLLSPIVVGLMASRSLAHWGPSREGKPRARRLAASS
jgi:membrane protein DedA with SNARE-associated domain